MPNVIFLENGTSATQDLSFYNTTAGTVTSDAGSPIRNPRSLKLFTSSPAVSASVQRNAVLADTGRRISFRCKTDTLPAANSIFFRLASATVTLSLTPTGKLLLSAAGGTNVTGLTTLAVNAAFRIAFSYVITSATVYSLKVFLNSLLELSIVNIGTLASTGFTAIQFFAQSTAGINVSNWFDDIYIDDGNTLDDPGNIMVTSKRPFANGALNQWTNQLGSGGSGYGSGHAPQVNEQPLTTANAWRITSASLLTEEYTIEGAAVGDLDITPAKYSIVDYMGWVYAVVTPSASTGNIIVNGVTSNVAVANVVAMYTKAAGSTTYPSGNAAIGMDNNSVNQTWALYECGILVAVKSNVAPTTTDAPTTAEVAKGFNDFKATDAPTTAESLIKLRAVPRSFTDILKADAEFTPDLLIGLQLWLAADSLALSDGTAVGTWPDLSGNGRNAIQGTGANQPLFKVNIINGLPALSFDGTNDQMTGTPPLGLSQPFTIIVVGIQVSKTFNCQWLQGDSASVLPYSYFRSGLNGGFAMFSGTSRSTSTDKSGSPHIATGIYQHPSSLCFCDGVNQSIPGDTGTNATDSGHGYLLGGSGGLIGGYYAELLVYNSALNTAQRNQVEGYLGNKYGLIVGGGLQPQPVRTIAAPRPVSEAVSTAESVDRSELSIHTSADSPSTAEASARSATLFRTTTD